MIMKKLRLTIRTRLSLLFAFSSVLVLLILSLCIYLFTYNFRKNEFRHRMEERLTEADSLLRKHSVYPLITLDQMPPGTLPEEQFFYTKPSDSIFIFDTTKRVFLSLLQQLQQERYYFTERGDRYYLLHYDKKLGNVIVVSAIDVFGISKIHYLKKVLMAGIVSGALAMAFISWYWPRRELSPISEKIRKARTIGAESLNLRLNVKNDYDELGELALTFNQMLDRIEKGFETQKQFISNAAHELRNPITVISGEAQLSLMQQRTESDYKEALQRIKSRSDELKKLVDRLLILSKIESAKNSYVKNPIRIDELLIDTVASIQNKYNKRIPAIHLHIEQENSERYTVCGDAVMLQIALDNILENGIKYGNGKPLTVTLGTEKGDAILNIKDEGVGIHAEECEKVFQPFYRPEGVRHIRGTGIGLALVKSIMEWHGWKIRLQPNHPGGTVVRILFS
jgi:signal transduction histidine kinase